MAKAVSETLLLALDIGGTNSRGELVRWDGGAATFSEPLASHTLPTPSGNGDAAIATIIQLSRALLDAVDEEVRGHVRAVGLGVPGVLDSDAGVVKLAANLGWTNRHVAGELEAALGIPVYLTHDVTAAGTAEMRLGAGRGVYDVLAVFLGTGIAATLVSGGRIVRGGQMPSGNRQPAGEIGHMPIAQDGPLCACGQRGCLELYCSARSVGRLYSEALGIEPNGPDARTSRDVVDCLDTDPVARAVWDDAVRNLAFGLFTASMVSGPTRIILGGGLAAAGAVLLDPVVVRMKELATVIEPPEIVLAQLGQRAGVLGVGLVTLDWLTA